MGADDEVKRRTLDAVLASRDAALDMVRPSIGARNGLSATDREAPLHPKSEDDVLEPGMVFMLKPAVYLKNLGGVRKTDIVAVTEDGPEVSVPFKSSWRSMLLINRAKGSKYAFQR